MSSFCHLRRLVFDQSSPVFHISESRGGYPEREGLSPKKRTEILVSYIGYQYVIIISSFSPPRLRWRSASLTSRVTTSWTTGSSVT